MEIVGTRGNATVVGLGGPVVHFTWQTVTSLDQLQLSMSHRNVATVWRLVMLRGNYGRLGRMTSGLPDPFHGLGLQSRLFLFIDRAQ